MADVVAPPPSQTQPHNLSPLHSHKMPHAVEDWDQQKESDDVLIQRLLAGSGQENDDLEALNQELNNQSGEKANDAVDYGDIDDDDDLPDEEPNVGVSLLANGDAGHIQELELNDQAMNDYDDPGFDELFGGDGDMFGSDPLVPDSTVNGANGLLLPDSLQADDTTHKVHRSVWYGHSGEYLRRQEIA